ncbi:cell division protein FtsK [Algibacter lectus]|uniref:Cell division protein FtsK n=1 Tax=Algibacter lectus TaxID=221126 RepID=A0A090WTY1_9FLAO|nr:cell division protein FtsK [Algibacter lectus]
MVLGGVLIIIWSSILLGFFGNKNAILGGTIGFEINSYLQDYIGKIGVVLLLVFGLITYLAIRFKVTFESIANQFKSAKSNLKSELSDMKEDIIVPLDNNLSEEAEDFKSTFNISEEEEKPIEAPLEPVEAPVKPKVEKITVEKVIVEDKTPLVVKVAEEEVEEEDLEMKVVKVAEEVSETDNLANKLVEDFGQFDPTLELGKYQFPPLDLLKQYDTGGITINQEELESNKNKIVETLNNYKIGIASIKATIGPTVTLYEIVPEAGVRISKIKNLEDDIALSLAALGIRIIAPIPGKGTIGIEVPNKNSTIVSMRSVIASKKFQASEMHLPIALGKTISNETFVVDLAKMPTLAYGWCNRAR